MSDLYIVVYRYMVLAGDTSQLMFCLFFFMLNSKLSHITPPEVMIKTDRQYK